MRAPPDPLIAPLNVPKEVWVMLRVFAPRFTAPDEDPDKLLIDALEVTALMSKVPPLAVTEVEEAMAPATDNANVPPEIVVAPV